MNSKVDELIQDAGVWREEFIALRRILLGSGLAEDVKWGQPCYTLQGKNVALIHGFKEYCAILFFKGALLADDQGLLVQQTGNVQAGRQIRFTGIGEIERLESSIKSYIAQAIEVEKAGKKVELKKTEDYPLPEELKVRLDGDHALRTAFESLTPGRQRAYIFHFGQAKQSKTREARIEKYIPKILEGLGLDD